MRIDDPYIMHGNSSYSYSPQSWEKRALSAEAYKAKFRAALVEISRGVVDPEKVAETALTEEL